MLKLILRFIELAEAALARGVLPQAMAELAVLRKLRRMGEEIGEDDLDQVPPLRAELEAAMAALDKATPHAA
jgi:V/A-type H+-transporting ATPase subunit A